MYVCVCVCALDKWMLDLLSRPDWLAIPTGTSSAAFAGCFPRAPQLREPLEEESKFLMPLQHTGGLVLVFRVNEV